ncbi:MAG: hypothetical protein GYA02_03950 [Clostridiaceae bacterium]|jgi:uncharacterized membrane protein|nr:hypothetical protein [Clostridiaceae bacterium]
MAKTVAAIFKNREYAENAARQLNERGLRTEDISIIAKENNNGQLNYEQENNENQAGNQVGNRSINDNISDGVMAGGVLGGLAGLLIGAGSMMIPGLGIIAAAGPITGLISGAVTGGVVGGLVDLGIPEKQSRQYETDIKAGKILFSMRVEDENVEQVTSILRNNGAVNVNIY